MSAGVRIRLPRGARRHLSAAHPGMARIIETVGPFAMRKRAASCELEALVRSIVYQQLSGKAAGTIYGRFLELYEGGFPEADVILKTHYTRLRKVGLSRQKQAAIRDLCRHVSAGSLPLGQTESLDDETLVERLTAVRGIGRWSAQMFMMFHLGRLDVWPEDDLGVRKAVARMAALPELPTRKQMLAAGRDFAPYRTVASWYLWRSVDGDAQI